MKYYFINIPVKILALVLNYKCHNRCVFTVFEALFVIFLNLLR